MGLPEYPSPCDGLTEASAENGTDGGAEQPDKADNRHSGGPLV
jgi:hypothetical protein